MKILKLPRQECRSYRWIVKKLKKNPQWTLEDIKQSLAPSEKAQRRERMAKEGPIAF